MPQIKFWKIRTERQAQQFWDAIPTEESHLWPVINVDLNGVLDVYEGWNGELEHYPPHPDARWFLLELRQHYNTLVVHTAILPIDFAARWLLQTGLGDLVDIVTNWKLPGQYIDDRTTRHEGDHADTLARVLGADRKTHWEKAKLSLDKPIK